MGEVDWCAHVVAAMGDERTKPQPEALHAYLQKWSDEYEREALKKASFDDLPPQVQGFLRWIAPTFRDGRPCGDEKVAFAAKAAWLRVSYGHTYKCLSMHLTWQKKFFTREGTKAAEVFFPYSYHPDPKVKAVDLNDDVLPGLEALTQIGESAGVSYECIRNIIYKK